MSFWVILLTCAGLALDDFIFMMGKGATLKDLTAEKTMSYAGIFGLVNLCAALMGYLVSGLFRSMLMIKLNVSLCALIFLLLGLWFVHKALTRKGIVEKLDLMFNTKRCIKAAMITNITTIFYGMGHGLMNTSLWMLLVCAFVTCFTAVVLALRIGYNYGYRYAHLIQGAGGALLLMMALNIWTRILG